MRWFGTLAALGAALIMGACSEPASPRLWTTLPPDGVARFRPVLDEYNKHQAAKVEWRNLASDELATALTTAAKGGGQPDWLLTPTKLARQLPTGTIQPWGGWVSVRLLDTLIPSFAKTATGGTQDRLLPLVADTTLVLANYGLADKGMGRLPTTIKEVGTDGWEFKRRTGRYMYLPAFGDPDIVLATVASHGVTFADPAGNLNVDLDMTRKALSYWASLIQQDVIPRYCLTMQMPEGIRRFLNQEGAAVFVTTKLAKGIDTTVKRGFKLSVVRYPTGSKETPPVETWGLFRVKSGSVDTASQNLAAFMLRDQTQWALSEAALAAPCVMTANRGYKGAYSLGNDVAEMVWATSFKFTRDATPLLPIEPKRDALALAMQQALKAMVDGTPGPQAIEGIRKALQ